MFFSEIIEKLSNLGGNITLKDNRRVNICDLFMPKSGLKPCLAALALSPLNPDLSGESLYRIKSLTSNRILTKSLFFSYTMFCMNPLFS